MDGDKKQKNDFQGKKAFRSLLSAASKIAEAHSSTVIACFGGAVSIGSSSEASNEFFRKPVAMVGGHTIQISNPSSYALPSFCDNSCISARSASKNPVTANLLAQYPVRYGKPTSPLNEVIATIRPRGADTWRYG